MEVKEMTISDVLKTPEFYNNLKVVISDLENIRRNARISANAPLKRHPIDRLQEKGVFEPGQMTVLYASAMDKKLYGYSSSERTFILKVGGEAFNKTMKHLLNKKNENMETKIVKTHTGKIYVDIKNRLEFLTVGDYGKENNIKANFLGLTKEINGVANTEVDLSKKWVATISTQKGCPMKCKFCDVPKYGFYGNVSIKELSYQIETIIKNEEVKQTERFNVHFARMGEPTWNKNVLDFSLILKDLVKKCGLKAKTVHPVISTMLPKANKNLKEYILKWCEIKNEFYNGEAGLQFSINSTDDEQRNELFDGKSLSLHEISELAKELPMPKGRKYTLNFPVTAQTILDAKKLSMLFDKSKFIVKITPIHETNSAIENGFEVSGYSDYDVYRKFEMPLLNEGWDVIVFVPSKEEDSDRITCGNALISYEKKRNNSNGND
jgi:23S rRNA (adenine2503-C2)-methyltransferase